MRLFPYVHDEHRRACNQNVSSGAPKSALESSDRGGGGGGIETWRQNKKKVLQLFLCQEKKSNSGNNTTRYKLIHTSSRCRKPRVRIPISLPVLDFHQTGWKLFFCFLEKKRKCRALRGANSKGAKQRNQFKNPELQNRITGRVRAVCGGDQCREPLSHLSISKRVGGGCGLLNGTEGSAMIKGNLRGATQPHRSPVWTRPS